MSSPGLEVAVQKQEMGLRVEPGIQHSEVGFKPVCGGVFEGKLLLP